MPIVYAVIALGVLMMWGKNAARGVRNNNPGNIKRTGDNWLGLRSVQSDPVFFQFDEPVYGIRALGKLLLNYESRYGLSTLRGIISRFAPSSENHTESYLRFVSDQLGIGPDEAFSIEYRLNDLVNAIIHFENGGNPYSAELVAQGLGLVYV